MYDLHIPAMLYRGLLAENEKINALMKSKYATEMLLAYSTLKREELYKSWIHGQGHIERVIMLGALIAMGEGFSWEDTRLALFACCYHDIGRSNDRRDDDHGTVSAEKIVSRGLVDIINDASKADIAILQAAIATHSMHDSALEANMEKYGVPEHEQERCRRICWCLKDADNMDRVRLNDLDPKYLRHETGKGLVDTCWYLLNNYIAARRADLA